MAEQPPTDKRAVVAPNINDILTAVLARERWPTVSNRRADKGGLTKGGVTFSSYNAWLMKVGRATVTPIEFDKAVTEDEARAFMLHEIAGPVMAVATTCPALFPVMVDWAETSGPDDPVRALQGVLRARGADIKVDGVYGVKTDQALAKAIADGEGIIVRRLVVSARVMFYVNRALNDRETRLFLAENAATDLHNLRGWVARALEFA